MCVVAVDHIFPIKRGGEHAICNFQLVTKDANRAKNTQTQSEFISLCKKVVEKHGS